MRISDWSSDVCSSDLRALIIETNAMPRLTKSEGLWRVTRKRDGRPGNWRLWALQTGLIVDDLADPDGFRLVPHSNPPLHYPADEIGHLIAEEAKFRRTASLSPEGHTTSLHYNVDPNNRSPNLSPTSLPHYNI